MLIGQLSKRSGLSRDTIRYYEKLQLLVVGDRVAGNDYKNYTSAALDRLRHIQQLKAVGFTLREIRNLLASDGGVHPCQELPQQLAGKIEQLSTQISALAQVRASLVEMQGACTGACSTAGGVPSCVPSCIPSAPAPRQAGRCC